MFRAVNPGTVAGITFGVLVAFLVTSLVCLYVVSRRNRNRSSEAASLNFDNPNYRSAPISNVLELKDVKKDSGANQTA